jgi:hypothetical protein
VLVISRSQITALEAAVDIERHHRFASWWQTHASLLGSADLVECEGWLLTYGPEAEVAGIAADEARLFLYVAARRRMPTMSGPQYVAAMDAVFAPINDRAKIAVFDEIAQMVLEDV